MTKDFKKHSPGCKQNKFLNSKRLDKDTYGLYLLCPWYNGTECNMLIVFERAKMPFGGKSTTLLREMYSVVCCGSNHLHSKSKKYKKSANRQWVSDKSSMLVGEKILPITLSHIWIWPAFFWGCFWSAHFKMISSMCVTVANWKILSNRGLTTAKTLS